MSRFSTPGGLFVVLALAGTTLAGDTREDDIVEDAALYRCGSFPTFVLPACPQTAFFKFLVFVQV